MKKNFIWKISGVALAAVVVLGGVALLPTFQEQVFAPELSGTTTSGEAQSSAMSKEPEKEEVFIPLEMVSDGTVTLTTDQLEAVVDSNFPRVISYTLKMGTAAGEQFDGQKSPINRLRINGVDVIPTVRVSRSEDGKTLQYRMTVLDQEHRIDADIVAQLSVEGQTLTFSINQVESRSDRLKYPLQSIEIPNHHLISVTEGRVGGNLKGAQFGTDTTVRGDKYYSMEKGELPPKGESYFYAFLSDSKISAGISSNSQVGTAGAGADNFRVVASTQKGETGATLGLSSAVWYYDRPLMDSYPNKTAVSAVPAEQQVVRAGENEFPFYVKVVLTGDENGDKTINWLDGAIAARESIVHMPYGSEAVPEVLGTRIAMNFGSQAQNPFLTTLDNVKRIANHTDGLGQGVLLKGYASEGHDSGHPDYAHIGERMGGEADFSVLLKEGNRLGASFGVHINASEFYPESVAFDETTLLRDENNELMFGWQWLDQAIALNTLKDMATGARYQRFSELRKVTQGQLDFVYVDIWGNQKSGTEDAWQTRKLSGDITGNGFRMMHEWGYANEWDTTYAHWVNDYDTGTPIQKSLYNSEVLRFLFNSNKDVFVPDFPHYGGAANAPLLGGAVMEGFEGWQKDAHYGRTVQNIYNQLLPTKFLQHYDLMIWKNAKKPLALPYDTEPWETSGKTANWLPEAQLTLQNKERTDTVVVTRGLDSTPDDSFSYETEADKVEYRSRVITLNGITILTGAPKPGDAATKLPSTLTYLLPWFWAPLTGEVVAEEGQKLYHYNAQGGRTTWTLPESWQKLPNVSVYELSDNGRLEELVIPVLEGKITVEAKAGVPYVVYRGEPIYQIADWNTAPYLGDLSFHSENLTDYWKVSGKAERYQIGWQIPMVKMTGTATVSQQIRNLEPGKQYAAYVGVDNRSDGKASLTITDSGGKVLSENYTMRSIAINYIGAYIHNLKHAPEGDTSYFQNMAVFFTAPSDGTATLTLSRAGGEGSTFFDDVRVLESEAENFTFGKNGEIECFQQDFEAVLQGQYPFVVAEVEGSIDNRQHLSERHEPYTQAGWDQKKLDDVIDGDWSLKVYAQSGKSKLIYQTIPQNFRFEPGVEYEVSFDYQTGAPEGYAIAIGTGEYKGNPEKLLSIPTALGGKKTGHFKFTIVGDASGQSWFGLYSGKKSLENAPKNSSLNDFVLDNLQIVRK